MLAQEVAAKYPGKVQFVNENFGISKFAEKFGVQGYPAVFVDDVLVARPPDFGFFGGEKGGGRYTPWRNAESQEKFKVDLARMIDLVLAGKKEQLRAERSDTGNATPELAAIPAFKLTDLSGHPLTAEDIKDRVVLVEFWATWCPPCRTTLHWLGDVKKKYGDKVAVVGFAVESPEDQVRATAGTLSPELRLAISDADTARAFGDIVSVPTMFVFDKTGKTAKVLYGAPPDLHEQAEKTLNMLLR